MLTKMTKEQFIESVQDAKEKKYVNMADVAKIGEDEEFIPEEKPKRKYTRRKKPENKEAPVAAVQKNKAEVVSETASLAAVQKEALAALIGLADEKIFSLKAMSEDLNDKARIFEGYKDTVKEMIAE